MEGTDCEDEDGTVPQKVAELLRLPTRRNYFVPGENRNLRPEQRKKQMDRVRKILWRRQDWRRNLQLLELRRNWSDWILKSRNCFCGGDEHDERGGDGVWRRILKSGGCGSAGGGGVGAGLSED
jgi:hypothetical protein